jgi:hypothetical protein
VLVASYPFLSLMWTMLVFFAFVIWLWILFTVFADIFRRHDIGGWAKALWVLFVIVAPFLGVLIYLIIEHAGMAERSAKTVETVQAQQEAYIRSVAGSGDPAAQIAKAKGLLDSGAITQEEFDALKAKALA